MIHISKPFLTSYDTHTKLNFYLTKSNNEKELIWYEVENQYASYLCTERIDGVVVNLLFHCMSHKEDIVSDYPISEQLYYQLTNFFIPIISQNIDTYSAFKITAPLDGSILKSEQAVGTGLSCGVDSFSSILKNLEKETKNFNVTHFTFFNAGASGSFGGEDARKLYYDRMNEVVPCANVLDIPLVSVDTNINEYLNIRHVKTHTVRSLAMVFILQKLFSKYYYSSGVPLDEFKFFENDSSYFDWFTLSCLNSENLTFYSTGSEVDRYNKIMYISDNEFVRQYLNVCISEEKNCCKCKKCKRTIIDLYAMGQIQNFEKVFDLDYIYANIDEYLIYLVANRFDKFHKVSYQILKKQLTFKVKLLGNISFLVALIVSMLKKTFIYQKLKHNHLLRKILRKN